MRILVNGFSEKTIDSATEVESETVDCKNMIYACVAITYGAAVAGVLKLQESVDGETWFDVPGQTVTIAAAGTSLFKYVDENSNVCEMASNYLKLNFVPDGGGSTGMITARFAAKGA